MSDAATALSSTGTLTTVVNRRAQAAPRKWTDAEVAELERLRTVEGLSFEEIGERLGRSAGSVNGKATIMGITLPTGFKVAQHRRLTPTLEAEMRKLWAAGVCVEDAARGARTSKTTASKWYRVFSEQARAAAVAPSIGTYIGHKEMMAIVAPICGVPASAIKGPTRLKPNVCARMAISKALHDRGVSLSRISKLVGRNDHSSVINYLRKFESYCRGYPITGKAYQAIKAAEAQAAERLAA